MVYYWQNPRGKVGIFMQNHTNASPTIYNQVRNVLLLGIVITLLLSLVESNQCVSIVPAVKYEELYLQGGHQNVVCREYADGAPEAYWGIAYNKRRPLDEHGQRFRAFVRDYFTRINAEYAAATRA